MPIPTENFQLQKPENGELADADVIADDLDFIDAKLAEAVYTTGTQSIPGAKTFIASPTVPTPVNDGHAATKEYVDGVAASAVPNATTSTKGGILISGKLAGTYNNISFTTGAVGDNEVSSLSQGKITGLTSALAAKETSANKGTANGYASLGSDGKIPSGQLPSIAINDVFAVNSQSAMLALGATVGDVAVRSDNANSYVLSALPASTLGNWLLLSSGSGVSSINGSLTGAVTGIEVTSAKGAASGYAPLDSSSKVPTANLPSFVDLSTTQSIGGAKTFSGSISVPTPSSSGHATTKAYVDALVASVSSGGYTQGSIFYNVASAPYSADITGANPASGAIQTAIDDAAAAGGGIVFLPAGTYKISATIVLKAKVTLMGAGKWATVLKAANSLNASVIKNFVSSDTTAANGEFVSCYNFQIHGNDTNQSAGLWYGIEYSAFPLYAQTTNDLDFDTHNRIENVMIFHTKSDGFHGTGRSEMRLLNCFSYYVGRYGFFGSFDTFYVSCTSGHAGSNGFHWEDSSVRASNCKSFYSGKLTVDGDNGHGFALRNGQGGLNLSNCEAQDNAGNGFALNNCNRGTLTGCVADSNSSTHVNSTVAAGDYVGFDLYNSSYNTITGCIAYERKAYGTSYQLNALQIRSNSNYNRIELTHSATTYNTAVVGDPLKAGSAHSNNYIRINAQGGSQTPATASTVTVDPFGGTTVIYTLTQNTTFANPASGSKIRGSELVFVLQQDATGSRTVAWGSDFVFPTAFTVSSTANSYSTVHFVCDGSKWVRVG